MCDFEYPFFKQVFIIKKCHCICYIVFKGRGKGRRSECMMEFNRKWSAYSDLLQLSLNNMSSAEKDYNDMTPEEREAHDKAAREKEEAEQAQLPYK